VAGWPVRAREHREAGVLAGERIEARDDAIDRRQQHLVPAALQHARVREVVDVLGGGGEVDELGGRAHLGVAREALAQPVFDRLHVVIGGGLDRLDALGVLELERGGGSLELGDGGLRERGEGGEGILARESQQPRDLDGHALAHEREFAEVILQRAGLGGGSARRGARGR